MGIDSGIPLYKHDCPIHEAGSATCMERQGSSNAWGTFHPESAAASLLYVSIQAHQLHQSLPLPCAVPLNKSGSTELV